MLSLRFRPHHESSLRPDSSFSVKHTHTHNTPSHNPPPGFTLAPPALSTAQLQVHTSLSWWTAVVCSAFPQPPSSPSGHPEGPLEGAAAVASLHTYSRACQRPRSTVRCLSAQGLRALTPAHHSASSHQPLPSWAGPAVHLAGPSSPFWSQIRCRLCREAPPAPAPPTRPLHLR